MRTPGQNLWRGADLARCRAALAITPASLLSRSRSPCKETFGSDGAASDDGASLFSAFEHRFVNSGSSDEGSSVLHEALLAPGLGLGVDAVPSIFAGVEAGGGSAGSAPLASTAPPPEPPEAAAAAAAMSASIWTGFVERSATQGPKELTEELTDGM